MSSGEFDRVTVSVALTSGQQLASFRAAFGLSLDDLADRLATEPRWSQIDRAAYLASIEAGTIPFPEQLRPVLIEIAARELGDGAATKGPES